MIKNYKMFIESLEIGDDTDHGKVLWVDKPYKNKDGSNADLLVKIKPFDNKEFIWARESEITKLEKDKPMETQEITNNLKPEIEFSDLIKSDIRACRVEKVERVKGKDRLLLLTVDTGFDQRPIVTNLGGSHKPEELEGKIFPFILNLKPTKIAGIESKGMIFAADKDGKTFLMELQMPLGSRII